MQSYEKDSLRPIAGRYRRPRRQINVAGRIERHGGALHADGIGGQQIAGPGERRIDDQRLGAAIAPQHEADLASAQLVAAGNLAAPGVRFLIDDGTVLAELAASGRDHQVARIIHAQTPGAFHAQADAARIGSASQLEIIFQAPILHVVNHVDARIQLGVANAGIGGDVLEPARGPIALDVVHDAGQSVFALAVRAVACGSENHRDAGFTRNPFGAAGAQGQGSTGSVHDEFRRSGFLAAIRLKGDRQAGGRRQGGTQQ